MNNSAARLLPVGTILLTTRATIGLRAILQHEAATNQGFQSLVVGCNIGKRSYISENSSVLYCDIGNYVSIASNCFIGGASHPVDWVSTSPVFQDCRSVLKQKINCKPYDPYTRTIIGNDVWIGTHSLIKAGVSIGDGAVIGMGSVVTHDVGPYEIWAGNPARMIRRRFKRKVIFVHENIASLLGMFLYR